MTDAYRRLGPPMEMRLTAHEMELENQSRVVCLPCREDTIRGYAIPLCPGSGERGIAWIASLRKRCEAEHSRCTLAHLSPDDHSPLTVRFCTMGQGTGKKCSMTRRTRAREVALQLLFQRDHNPGLTRADLERFAAERLRDERLQQFCLSLVDGVTAHQADIDAKLSGAAENWRLPRMATVDRNLLRLGAFEMLIQKENPPAVVLDEVIELARRFGATESSAFVNGVLDRLRRDAETAAQRQPPATS